MFTQDRKRVVQGKSVVVGGGRSPKYTCSAAVDVAAFILVLGPNTTLTLTIIHNPKPNPNPNS